MSTEKLRILRAEWQGNTFFQHHINDALDRIGFDDIYVDAAKKQATAGLASKKNKYVKDNIWGMVELGWREMRLLDSPLLQRLRGVKQLGLTYLTYPSGSHSRFAHSVGMTCVVDRLLTAVEKRASEHDREGDDLQFIPLQKLEPVCRTDLVHAALLHDIGHFPLSHAMEKVLTAWEDLITVGNKSVADVRADTDLLLGKSLDLAEIFTLVLILSVRFEKFYTEYIGVGEDPDALLRIASLIAGLPPSPELPGVSELISAAAVDADKIDYVNRDAQECGIPVGVDVSRIFLRSGFVLATRDQMIRSGLKEIHYQKRCYLS